MKTPFGVRLWILSVALVAVAGGILWELSAAWRRVERLESSLTSTQMESFRIASQVQTNLSSLYDSILHYVLVRDPAQWEEFDRAGKDFDRWTDEFDPKINPKTSPLTTKEEKAIYTQVNQAISDYLTAAREIHSNGVPPLVKAEQLTQLNALDKRTRDLRVLVRSLAEAHRKAETGFLGAANARLTDLRNMLTFSVLALLLLVAVMGRVIYRDAIAPLRTRLVYSQSLLEKQEKLATLGTLAAGIAHEIRNPLTSLKARLYTLEKHLQTLPAARKDTDIINAEITRLERIVRDVLNFARPSEPKLETLAADSLLREIHSLMSAALENRGIKLLLEDEPDLFIRVDASHLKQVLINLVRNAADAIDGAGMIKLCAKGSHARLRGHEREAVILEVVDNGKGIPPEVEKRLFDPFFSTKETGTGLGLPIAARIVEKHGGMLRYQTQPGRGTTFGVVLPRELEKPSERRARDTAVPA